MSCSWSIKKRYYYSISIILACFLLFSFLPSVSADGSDINVYVNPSSKSVLTGSTFTIDVNCDPSQPIKAFELSLSFNPEFLEIESISEGDIFEGYTTFFNSGTIDNTAGTVTDVFGLIIGNFNVSQAGSLITLEFNVKSNTGSSTLSLDSVGITDETGYLSVSNENGEIIVYESNSRPVVSAADPANQSINVEESLSTLSVYISDVDGDSFNWDIVTEPDIGSSNGANQNNGTKTCSVSDLSYSTTYYWYVYCQSVESGNWTNKSYWFTTESAPNPGDGDGDGDGGNNGGNNNDEDIPDDIPIDDETEDDSENESVDLNHPPNNPLTPVGSTNVEIDGLYQYSSSTFDVDDDLIRYKFDWGDGSFSDWSDFVESNQTIDMSHSWDEVSNYQIRVIAQDENGSNSSWSDALTTMVAQADFPPIDLNNTIDSEPNFEGSETITLSLNNFDHYLVDLDKDGVIDLFFNSKTGVDSNVEYKDNNTVYLDFNGDGSWDYVYNLEDESLSVYNMNSKTKKTKNVFFGLGGLVLISVVISVIVLMYVYRRKIKLSFIGMKIYFGKEDSFFKRHNFLKKLFKDDDSRNYYITSNVPSNFTFDGFIFSEEISSDGLIDKSVDSSQKKGKVDDADIEEIHLKVDKLFLLENKGFFDVDLGDIEKSPVKLEDFPIDEVHTEVDRLDKKSYYDANNVDNIDKKVDRVVYNRKNLGRNT